MKKDELNFGDHIKIKKLFRGDYFGSRALMVDEHSASS